MTRVLWVLAVVAIAACGSRGGYYKDDGPPRGVKASDIEKIPNAVPKLEPLSKTGNKPYQALGKTYYPIKSAQGYRERGVASWYGKKFHGRRTSSGEAYDMFAMTAAHKVLPLPSYVKVRSIDNGRTVIVKVNDRGPFLHNRLIDLSYAAAYKLGVVATGTGLVEVEVISPSSPDISRQAPVSSRSVTGPRLFVQFGAFSIKSNAEDLRHRLHGHGLSPVIQQGLYNGRNIYRVMVGPYNMVSEVDAITEKSRRHGYETKLIIE